MDFFFQLIDTCDLVIYGDLGGFVTAGVANEIEYALRQGKPVYRIDWRTGEIKEIREVKNTLSITESRMLSDALTYLMLDDVEAAEVIKAKWKGSFMETLTSILSEPTARRLHRLEEQDLIDILSRFYHWWQEPANIAHNVDVKKLKELVAEKIKEIGEKSLRSYILKTLSLLKTWYDYYTYLSKEERVKPIEVGTLKKLCEDLKIPYVELEKRLAIINPNYPIDLNNPSLFKMAIHIINEGYTRTKTKSIEYYNSDPVLHHYLKCRVEELGGGFSGPFKAHKVLVSYADPLIGRLLDAIGAPYGSKTINQPFVDLKHMRDDI